MTECGYMLTRKVNTVSDGQIYINPLADLIDSDVNIVEWVDECGGISAL